ncbi:hypothetical protein AB0J25_09895 [Streptomyces sp. NPDC049910]|uniref:hypothetical protein n=1 Tax=Streptomyces sp. NPDC049910 TaxID=3155278 RepID=UPI003421FE6E
MKQHRRLGTGTALLTAAALGSLALAPAATAVEPTTATMAFECSSFGSGSATLTATQDGTAATINLSTSAIKSPFPLSANSISSTLTLTKNGSGTATFTGRANPAIPAGATVSTGPLKGTVAAGDSLEAESLTVVVFGISVACHATSPQDPGPFVF